MSQFTRVFIGLAPTTSDEPFSGIRMEIDEVPGGPTILARRSVFCY